VKRSTSLGLAFIAVVVVLASFSFSSLAENEVAVRLRFGRVVEGVQGPGIYLHLPFIEALRRMKRSSVDYVSAGGKEVVVKTTVTEPAAFYLQYFGNREELLKRVQQRIAADGGLRSRLEQGEVPYETKGATVLLSLK
jgi:regulator of protease activity HflC (stomatin/prohibitin superfamily)